MSNRSEVKTDESSGIALDVPTKWSTALLGTVLTIYVMQKVAISAGFSEAATIGVLEMMMLALLGIGFAVLSIATQIRSEEYK